MKTLVKVSCLLMIFTSIIGCSNNSSSKKTSKTGTAIFFHNIEGSPTLQLNAVNHKDRNGYGTVSFETFSTGVALKPKTWNLEVVDEQDTADTTDDEVILDDVNFAIKAKSYQIIAFTGEYDTEEPDDANLQMHVLDVAEDTETDDDDEELIQYINVSHINKNLGPLDIYLVSKDQSTDNLDLLTPVDTIDFGETTEENIRLQRLSSEQPNYYVRIALADNPSVEIYNSGERELQDYTRQTILISPNLSDVGSSDIVAFYYGSGHVERWYDKDDNIGALRVFNGILDSSDLDAVADSVVSDSYDRDLAQGLGFAEVSSYVTNIVAEDGTYTVKAFDAEVPVSTQIAVDIDSAEFWTVVFYGRVNDASGIPVKEIRSSSGSQANITFTNAAYYENDEDIKSFNVHIKKSTEKQNAASVDISDLAPGSYSNIVEPEGSYEIVVTRLDNQNTIDRLYVDLQGNTNYHFVITEDATNCCGYAIHQL